MLRLASPALVLALIVPQAALAGDEGFQPLFDGKSTAGWSTVGGKPGNWLARDGLLITKGEGGGWLSTRATYSDFVLRLEYRTGPGGNSGVFLRAPHTGDPAYTGMEIQLLDDNDKQYKDLQPYQYTGSIYGVVAAERGHTKPPGQWNAMEIRAEGPRITVTLNGATITRADLRDHAGAAKQHPGILRRDGHLGLQSHSDEVQFRNIEIQVLKSTAG
jgi:hypothetical protein